MIHLIADERHACAHAHGELTVGSRGIPVQVGLSDDFDGLAVTICFQAGTERAEVVWYEGEEINVPPQCLTKEGERLLVGVYGAKADGTVVIPTIWATAGIVKRGTDLTGVSPLDPEPDWTAQVQSIAAEAIETANSVRADADAGEFDGFSPTASVAKSGDTATITITDKDGTTTASIRDGYDTSGSVVQDGTTAIITLTDHDGTTRAEVHDGISPSASVTQTETGATVTVTDRSGTTTAQITNGATGPQGERGPQGPKGDTGDGATRIEYGSGIILVQCDADGRTNAWGGGFDVRAYVGAEQRPCTAAIGYAPSWLTINVTNNASGTPAVRYSWQQGQAASNDTVGMTVATTDVSGTEVTYQCTLNVTTVRDGAAGADGEDGYGFVPVDGTFVPIHTNPDNTTRAGRHELVFEAYSGSEELDITGMTLLGPSWLTATQSSIAPRLLVLTWPDGETLVDSVGCSLTLTIDDHGTTRYEYSEIVVGAVKDGADGYSPTVTVAPITGGHEVTVTDAGGSQSFDVMDGKDGGQKLTGVLTGETLAASDAYAAPPVDAMVYGASTQSGTPTPSSPVPILSVDALTLHAGDGTTDATEWPVAIDLQGHELRGLPDGTRDELTLTPEGTAYRVTLTRRTGEVTLKDEFDPSDIGAHYNTGGARRWNVGRVTSDNVMRPKPCMCSTGVLWYNSDTYSGAGNRDHYYFGSNSGTLYVVAMVSEVTTAVMAQWMNDNLAGATLVYPLATEQTIDLGTVALPDLPAPDVTVWADGGSATPSLSLTYERDITIALADMQAEVEHVWAQLAPVEQETATANHAAGTYLVLGGTLCKVTQAIAIGETVAIGTNVAATTVAAELLAIQA